ncbi:hypothetical protein E8E14_001624 [Neopestalotiopsis sp. 37M]|nr:hypothetical protein E8E14_001624 [Neopestalotiopsis sp. 37M]
MLLNFRVTLIQVASALLLVVTAQLPLQELSLPGSPAEFPSPPNPEPIELSEVPLPPAVQGNASCSTYLNPRETGCISQMPGLAGVSFMPDGHHLVLSMIFAGAPSAPNPASIYTGNQLVLLKVDNTTFSNGDTWKCITCGVPDQNIFGDTSSLDYPQAFRNGKRVLAGTNIIECGDLLLAEDACTPQQIHIYPIRWRDQVDDSGSGGEIRELRLNPDSVHLAFNAISFTAAGVTQHSFVGRLEFNPQPSTGTPLSPRYDLTNINLLVDSAGSSVVVFEGNAIRINRSAIAVGETRGFSEDGLEVTYIGYNFESCNNDVFAVHLRTGVVRRLTAHPEYVDPVDISPDNRWHVVEDTRLTGRQMFLAAMRGIPPILDLLVNSAVSSTRNNGGRRFFQPWLLDRYGDRGSYIGQELNGASNGTPGSGAADDPEWNARADPKWSLDGTRIVYFQRLTVSPECGGINPLPCYASTEPGGRIDRIMIANLISRDPLPIREIDPIADDIPWAIPYSPGMSLPGNQISTQSGIYSLKGAKSGEAQVAYNSGDNGTALPSIAVKYTSYSDDGLSTLEGFENATLRTSSGTLVLVDWFSNITQTGEIIGTKITSPNGFHLAIDILTNSFNANGTLTTTINGVSYYQPANGT